MWNHQVRLASALAASLWLVACASKAPAPDRTLYQRLGGKPAISAVVDDFVANIAADSRINRRFAKADGAGLKAKLVDQICAGTGGPCTYTGDDMKTVHRGMRIRDYEFDAMVEDLVKSLDRFNVPAREKNEVLGILGPMKPDIVGQ